MCFIITVTVSNTITIQSHFTIITGAEPFALSLLWPVKNIDPGDLITRNYLPNVSVQDPTRSLRLLAFQRDGYVVEMQGGSDSGDNVAVVPPAAAAAALEVIEKDRGEGGGGGGGGESIADVVDSSRNSMNTTEKKESSSKNVSSERVGVL